VIEVTVPAAFEAERRYIVEVLLAEFLGLDYRLKLGPGPDYRLVLENGGSLTVRDHFFAKFSEADGYLAAANIPARVPFVQTPFGGEEPVPVIYGHETVKVTARRIDCGLDLFASAFFLLSRWEEYVAAREQAHLDSHGRFPATASLAFKAGFIDRPVVNEYVELLWRMLRHLGIKQERREKIFSCVLSHDVDVPLLWRGWSHVLRTAAADVVKRGRPSLAASRFKEYGAIFWGQATDPFDTFDQLMDEAESLGQPARFYFKAGGKRTSKSKSEYDRASRYNICSPKVRRILRRILARGHIVGFHPGYAAFDDAAWWRRERQRLEAACGCRVEEGRQHYLRFRLPHTWQLWEDQGMRVDSTCGFADREGFRCGTGDAFRVFNILTRRGLDLKERPLVFMDSRNFVCGGYRADSLLDHRLADIIQSARRHCSAVTLLFHNNLLAEEDFYRLHRDIMTLVKGS
jgi:hypothetical protein